MAVALGTTVTVAPTARPRTEASAAAVLTPYRATVVVNGARSGPVFQGIGAISGGGGNSRLLIDYPPRERAQILDYLFSPHFGASLQLLKLEIGGGGFSTDGSEPSVEPAQGQPDCGAGYEFWLARQALARNPAIKLYGLQWTAPAWVIAQTTQFTAPGWRHAAGANGILPAGGSYDTYLAPGRSAWSMVAETSVSTAAQQITVHVTGGLPARVVHVWSTSLRGAGQFIRRGDIIPDRGAFGALLRPGYVYTFSTTTGQSRAGGDPLAVPVAGPMPVRYTATPDGAGLADMLAPIDGSFGYVHGVLTQTAAGEPVEWQYPGRSPAPYAIIGENTWRDYTVSARVILPASGTGSQGPR
jgi:hypothetical protein